MQTYARCVLKIVMVFKKDEYEENKSHTLCTYYVFMDIGHCTVSVLRVGMCTG